MKNLIKLFSVLLTAGFFLTSCEGPMGPAGAAGTNGTNGTNGIDANETCKECHNPTVVDAVAVQFEFSKHSYGEAAFEESGNTTCTPCHASEAFKYVCANNIPSTFTLNATTGKYSNDYATIASKAYGEIDCFTCHSSLHTTYAGTDFSPLTTTAAVSMTMWKGAKSIDLTQDGGMSNLCVKCHQPRPLTTSTSASNGDVVDYASLVSDPTAIFYDNAVGNAAPNKVIPSYRTHVHYGTVGAIFAGKGGVEFTGSVAYANSTHTTAAACQDCHMAAITGRAGGHTFRVRSGEGALSSSTSWNFNGCNATGCHSASPITSSNAASNAKFGIPRTEIKGLLNSLATKINSIGGGTDILHSQSDGSSNLWAGLTTGNYDGYLNIYDPSSNPAGVWKNPGSTSSWTTDQKAVNTALPTFPSLKNVVMGSMINFQMCLREFSLGIHNTTYSRALLQNSIDALTAAGI
ncbi:MAG: hypothetical protein EPN88_07065 [Bacteroidetes bacterium]|nr:MAG: hypothetical protein EPN88_07065 [Bacteroidota bacterium]